MARYQTKLLGESGDTTVIVEGRALGGRVQRAFRNHVKDEDIPAAVQACMDEVQGKVEPKQ